MEEKIKDIYHCKRLEGNDPLVIWYNQVIEKFPEELTISDVARCVRQNLFLETAYEMLLVYLLHNPYAGDIYDGELMDKVVEMDDSEIEHHKNTICEIITRARTFIKNHNWDCDEDQFEFVNAVDTLAIRTHILR